MSVDTIAKYSVRLSTRDGELVGYIDSKISALSWEWNRIGGCGACRMTLDAKFDAALVSSFAEDAQVEIYLPSAIGTAELWYSGFVDKVTPNVNAAQESVNVFALGYVNQLKRVIIDDQTYRSQDIAAIARSVAEVYATGITNVTTTAADFPDVGFVADVLYFNQNAHEAISRCAEIAGRREWGVRADKSLFFLARDEEITKYYFIDEDFVDYKPLKDYNPIVTQIFLKGSQGYYEQYLLTNRKTTRGLIVTNPAITTQRVGRRFARMYLKERGVPKRSYTGRLKEQTTRIEETIPLGKASVNLKHGVKVLYDSGVQYNDGTKYDGGTENFQIEKIQYTLTDTGINTTLFFGPVPPSISGEFGRLEYLIEAERIKYE